jgi:hypothetical protein
LASANFIAFAISFALLGDLAGLRIRLARRTDCQRKPIAFVQVVADEPLPIDIDWLERTGWNGQRLLPRR